MARYAYLTPDAGDGTTVTRVLVIPLEYLPIVDGAIEVLTRPENWEEFGDQSADDAAATMQTMIDDYYTS
jgi:hypothetical protein